MALRFTKNLAAIAGGLDPMSARKEMGEFAGLQQSDAGLAGTPMRQQPPPVDTLQRPMAPDGEAMRQATGEVLSPGAYAAQPRTMVADTAPQQMERAVVMSSNRQPLEDQKLAVNAGALAETVAMPQMAQQIGDQARAMSAGDVYTDTTGAQAAAQQAAMDYTWNVMSPEGRRAVDDAVALLAQTDPQIMGIVPGGYA